MIKPAVVVTALFLVAVMAAPTSAAPAVPTVQQQLANAQASQRSADAELARVKKLTDKHASSLRQAQQKRTSAARIESSARKAKSSLYKKYSKVGKSSTKQRSKARSSYLRAKRKWDSARRNLQQSTWATSRAQSTLTAGLRKLAAARSASVKAAALVKSLAAAVTSGQGAASPVVVQPSGPIDTTPLGQARTKLAAAQKVFDETKVKVDGHAATLRRDQGLLDEAIEKVARALEAERIAKQNMDSAQRVTASLNSAYWNAVAARRGAESTVNKYRGIVAGDRDRLAAGQKVLANMQALLDSAQALVDRLLAIYGAPSNNSDSGADTVPVTAFADPSTYDFSGALANSWTIYKSPKSDVNKTRDPANVKTKDGILQLRTHGLSGAGVCHCTSATYPRTPFGRWEVRARMDANADHGGAIMLWPNSENWPIDGEIDLAEFNAARTEVAFTIHYDYDNKQKSVRVPGDFTKWHTFRVDWSATGLVYFIDDKLVAATTDQNVIPQTAMHLSMEAGPGSKRSASNTTSTLEVAWVKVTRPKA